jgi:crotonobetainyl-CoA:carnitine CoA-transferase CaiB-like acyl-CoA transferase
MSDSPTAADTSSPMLGEHTSDVLSEIGYSVSEIKSLIESGAVSGIVNPDA